MQWTFNVYAYIHVIVQHVITLINVKHYFVSFSFFFFSISTTNHSFAEHDMPCQQTV